MENRKLKKKKELNDFLFEEKKKKTIHSMVIAKGFQSEGHNMALKKKGENKNKECKRKADWHEESNNGGLP